MEEKKEIQKEKIRIVTKDHKYEFVGLDALYGLGVYHEWLCYVGKDIDAISKAIGEMLSETGGDVNAPELFKRLISGSDVFTRLRELLIKVVSLPKLFELVGIFLAGAKIDEEQCDDLGMCPLFRKRPHEVYTALMMAVAANYQDYFPFVLEKLDTEASPSQP